MALPITNLDPIPSSNSSNFSDFSDLSVIILNWNAADDTVRCVRQIMQWRQLKPAIWVVDNASSDDSVAIIRQVCPTVHFLQNKQNLGFSGGTNRGLAASLAIDQRPILLLNNDAFIREEAVIKLLKTLREEKQAGFVGPLLFEAKPEAGLEAKPDVKLAAENREHLLSAGGKNPVLYHQTRRLRPDADQTVYPVTNISGTAILIRAETLQKVGLLDEAYFFSTELADLCARGKQQGYLSLIDSQAKAYHAVSRSAPYRNTLYVYYIIRNRFIYIRKFYGHLIKYALLSFWSFYSLALTLKLHFSRQQSTARAVYLGWRDGWQKNYGGQNERVLAFCQTPSPDRLSPKHKAKTDAEEA